MDEKQYTKIATADFTMKIVFGTIFGSIAFIGGIVAAIVFFVKGQSNIGWMFIALAFIGLLVAGIDGYLLFSRKKSQNNPTDTE